MEENTGYIIKLKTSCYELLDIVPKLESGNYKIFIKNIDKKSGTNYSLFVEEIIDGVKWICSVALHEIDHASFSSNTDPKRVSELFRKISILQSLLSKAFNYFPDERDLEKLKSIATQDVILNILNYIYTMKFDAFFKDNFSGEIDHSIENYIKGGDALNEIISCRQNIKTNESESLKVLERMKLTEKAVLREGLTRSFKMSVDELTKKIKWFDWLNYSSLIVIFLITLPLFIDIGDLVFMKHVKFKSVSVYERFVLIAPLLCLSWFASKRSQFLYQIKEEYSYKYAAALAYEGYKDEVDGQGSGMKDKLMEVTIDNLARSPLEQFDKNSDHAPYAQFIKEFRDK